MSIVYLALGTNLGDREKNLRRAIEALSSNIHVETISPVYETKAEYVTAQPPFYNAALKTTTDLLPLQLLSFLKEVEKKIGRTPTFTNGPRVIDLDILLYDDVVMQTPELTLPHPHIQKRAFVLAPLADIAPGADHPIMHKTVRELLTAVRIAPDEIKETGLTL